MASRTKVIPRLLSMLVISALDRPRHPAGSGAGHSKDCSPWMRPARLMPTSGSLNSCDQRSARGSTRPRRSEGRRPARAQGPVRRSPRPCARPLRVDPLTRRRVAPPDVTEIWHRWTTPQPGTWMSAETTRRVLNASEEAFTPQVDIRINIPRGPPYTRHRPESKRLRRLDRRDRPQRIVLGSDVADLGPGPVVQRQCGEGAEPARAALASRMPSRCSTAMAATGMASADAGFQLDGDARASGAHYRRPDRGAADLGGHPVSRTRRGVPCRTSGCRRRDEDSLPSRPGNAGRPDPRSRRRTRARSPRAGSRTW